MRADGAKPAAARVLNGHSHGSGEIFHARLPFFADDHPVIDSTAVANERPIYACEFI